MELRLASELFFFFFFLLPPGTLAALRPMKEERMRQSSEITPYSGPNRDIPQNLRHNEKNAGATEIRKRPSVRFASNGGTLAQSKRVFADATNEIG